MRLIRRIYKNGRVGRADAKITVRKNNELLRRENRLRPVLHPVRDHSESSADIIVIYIIFFANMLSTVGANSVELEGTLVRT